MKQEMKRAVFVAALLGLALAGCQKKEEAPTEMPAAEAPAPAAPMSETPPAPETAPSDSMPSQEPTPDSPPAQ